MAAGDQTNTGGLSNIFSGIQNVAKAIGQLNQTLSNFGMLNVPNTWTAMQTFDDGIAVTGANSNLTTANINVLTTTTLNALAVAPASTLTTSQIFALTTTQLGSLTTSNIMLLSELFIAKLGAP